MQVVNALTRPAMDWLGVTHTPSQRLLAISRYNRSLSRFRTRLLHTRRNPRDYLTASKSFPRPCNRNGTHSNPRHTPHPQRRS